MIDNESITIIPSREVSYDWLEGQGVGFASEGESIEDAAVDSILKERLHVSFNLPNQSNFDRLQAQKKIAELEETASQILKLIRSSQAGIDYFEEPLTKIYDERTALLGQIAEDDKCRAQSAASTARLESMMASI